MAALTFQQAYGPGGVYTVRGKYGPRGHAYTNAFGYPSPAPRPAYTPTPVHAKAEDYHAWKAQRDRQRAREHELAQIAEHERLTADRIRA